MKINTISLYSYDIPLTEAVSVSGRRITGRRGLIVTLRDRSGNTGFGEISPLPGLDHETEKSCLRDLLKFRNVFTGMELADRRFHLHHPLFGLAPLRELPGPIALFGIESALLMLSLKNGVVKIPGIEPGKKGILKVPVNGLFVPGEGKIDEQIDRLREGGFRTIKIKIGRHDPDREIRDIRGLTEVLKGSVFRLDGNRLMDMKGIMEYHLALKDMRIEYIEEPLRSGDPKELSWPCAVDESIGEYLDTRDPDFSRLPGWCRALVLKPGSLHGLHLLMKCAAWGGERGFPVTMSSSYNCGPGILALALAGALSLPEGAGCHGFDTLRYLERDLFRERLAINRGSLEIPSSIVSDDDALDLSCLREVS